jgi:hypothetical protein
LDVEIATTRFGGNVGIGTVLPLATLDVRGGSVFLGNVGVGTTTPRAAIDFAVPSLIMTGAVGIGTTLPNETMKFRVYGDGFLGGNLGIGTTVPRATLDIAGGGGGIGGGALVIPEGSVGIGTYSPMVPVDLAVATVRIAGNLGIGTTSPRGLLDVAGVGSVFLPQANIGIGTTFGPALPLEVWSPKAMLIPVGANADRPAAALKGYLRYNTTTDQFEGFGAGNQWGSLGGVRDVAGETYIAAEESAGAADNNLRFITSNVERMRINRNGNVGIGTNLPSALLHLYDREADRLTVLLNWNSPSGTRFASLDTPTNSFLDPVLFNTNQSWAFQTNGLTRASIGDIGLTVSSNATLLLPNAAAATPAMAFTASTTTGVFSPATHTLAISTQGTERLRVAGNGNVGIGTTVPNYPLDIVGNVNYSGGLYRNGVLIPPNVWSLSPNANTGPNQYYSAGNIGIGTSSPLYPLHVMGSIYTSQGVISTSDKRMKTDLVVIPEPLEKIKALRGYTYQWNNAGSGGGGAAAQELSQLKRETGLIAQELEGVFPEAVYEDPNGMKAINYGHLAGLFVESLRAIVERLERLERCAGAAPPLHSSS